MVSIILPTYNRAHLIERAINSVINQTYSDWELIIVDDGSTDNTSEVIKRYLMDQRIRYIKLNNNCGGSGARNVGLKNVDGEYVTFLDSDDEYCENKLYEQLKFLSQSKNVNLGVVTCGRIDYYNNEETLRFIPKKRKNYFKSLLSREKGIGAGTPFLMVNVQLLLKNKIYFDTEMPAMQDWDFLIRICRVSEMDVVKKYLVKVHHHNGDRIYNNKNVSKAIIIQYNKYFQWLVENKKIHFKHIKRSAFLLANNNSIESSIEFIKEKIIFFNDIIKFKLSIIIRLIKLFKYEFIKKIALKFF